MLFEETRSPVLRASGALFQRQMNGLLNTRFELAPVGVRPYVGEILRSYSADRVRLADIRFSPHSTRLSRGRSATAPGNTFLVSYQMEGEAVVRQNGREAHISANQLFFIDTSQPFEIETGDIWTRSIYLDSQFWQDVFPERGYYTATALDCDTGIGQTCRSLIHSIFEQAWKHPPETVTRLAGSLANLLAVSMVTSLPVAPSFDLSIERKLERIKAAVRRNLADCDLDCAFVAREVGMSLRQVHAVFSHSGTSLNRWIWSERLDRIASELRNPVLRHKPVSGIAFDWGYKEAAHFSRQFRARFGVTPSHYREASLRQDRAAIDPPILTAD
jgi:AraC family transcriptional activator of tynA and feaB